MRGISINPHIGIGDGIQYSSVPENYYRATGEKLVDVSRPWFFDHNPYVVRVHPTKEPKQIQELWNYSPTQYSWPSIRPHKVYLSNAEIHMAAIKVPHVVLNRPRLYRFEDFPFEKREKILLHVDGRSHGRMPDYVIKHVIEKYGRQLVQVGQSDIDLGIPKVRTKTLWELAEAISTARMFIGMDSGPSWIASCFPDIVVKKLRGKQRPEEFKNWVPLSEENVHSHWDDRIHTSYNLSEDDVGFTSSYRRL